jgi:hypothetical protein
MSYSVLLLVCALFVSVCTVFVTYRTFSVICYVLCEWFFAVYFRYLLVWNNSSKNGIFRLQTLIWGYNFSRVALSYLITPKISSTQTKFT